MPPVLSKISVLKTKPKKIIPSNTQTHAAQRGKTYSELPMIHIQSSYKNIPVINTPAQFSQELTFFFPNDLERSFHLGLLSACASPQQLKEFGDDENSESAVRPGNKLNLKDSGSVSGCDKNRLDFSDEYPAFFSEHNTHHFMKDGKFHQTYLSRKRTRKSGEQHSAAKRFLTCGVAEDGAGCQMTEFYSNKETSAYCEESAILTQQHTTEIKGTLNAEHDAFSSMVTTEPECRNVFAVNIPTKREKHVTFADDVDKGESSEHEAFHTSEQADFGKFISSKSGFCETDEQLVLTSDVLDVDRCAEDSEFSDPPFPLSQKYGTVAFEDWKLTEQDDHQEVNLYEDHNVP